MSRFATLLIVLTGIAGEAWAQSKAHVTLQSSVGGGAPVATSNELNDQGRNTVVGTLTVTVTCASGLDCAQVDATLSGGAAVVQPTQSSTTTRVFTIDSSTLPPAGTDLKLLYLGTLLKSFDLVPSSATQPTSARAATTSGTPLQDLLACDPSGVHAPGYEPYDRKSNVAWFEVTALGTLIQVPNANEGHVIDENDTVRITVIAHPDLIPFLRVKRSSATRALGGFSVAGAETQLHREAAVRCVAYTVELRDFAAGAGAVKISAQLGAQETEIGTFEFSVSPLYRGMLSFGAISSDVVNDSFKLAPNNGQTVIVPGKEGNSETFYSVLFTPFIWGPRDLEKPTEEWYHHLNPSFGVVTSNLDQHALVGISFDWGGFLFTVGEHYARTTVLSASSGLNVGDTFSGAADTIPTATKWESSTYYGVSVDIRAAAALLKSAFGSSAK